MLLFKSCRHFAWHSFYIHCNNFCPQNVSMFFSLAIGQVVFHHLLITTSQANHLPSWCNTPEKGDYLSLSPEKQLSSSRLTWYSLHCPFSRSSNLLPPLGPGDQRWVVFCVNFLLKFLKLWLNLGFSLKYLLNRFWTFDFEI